MNSAGVEDSITVASRELHDGFYRACRTSGVAHGEASSVASAVVFAVVHFGRTLDAAIALLESGRSPVFALPHVLRAAAGERVDTPEAWVTADIGYFAADALRRGEVIAMVDGDGRESSSIEWLLESEPETCVSQLVAISGTAKPVAQRTLRSIDDRYKDAQRTGLDLERSAWNRLDVLAQRYLISESLIDHAVHEATIC